MNTHNNHKRGFSPSFSFVTQDDYHKLFDVNFLVVQKPSLFDLTPGAIAVSTATRLINRLRLRRLCTRLVLARQPLPQQPPTVLTK